MEEVNVEKIRESTQFELPVKSPQINGTYNIYPTHEIEGRCIHIGYDSLAKELANHQCVKIDGYIGVFFQDLKYKLDLAFSQLGKNPVWVNVEEALKSEDAIDELIAPYLGGDDPVFGRRAELGLEDFYDLDKLESLSNMVGDEQMVYYGIGASLIHKKGTLIYTEISKNEIQFRSRAGSITNLGASNALDSKVMYKRFYFVDWVVLNVLKNKIKAEIDFLIDAQRTDEVTWISGDVWRKEAQKAVMAPVRVRPWFEPGAWGGQWIKDKIEGLNQDVDNYAWSFELIVPENGVIFESSGIMLEFSFDFLMFNAGEKILGVDFEKYRYDFPIRFDFLDTFDGGNLSVQCHPQTSYIQKHFGEKITQEETYYILDRKGDAQVFLGFQEGVKPNDFQQALETSFENGEEMDVTKYVQSFTSEKHGLYLIPPGTVHSSGKDNLVLEISSTPYIFTFKMYDWLRVDLDGKPRPINIQRGMDNLVFEYSGDEVEKSLISKPVTIKQTEDCLLEHLPTHKHHLYDVHRFILKSKVDVDTADKAHVLSLVEGDHMDVIVGDKAFTINYAETLIMPAAVGKYSIVNQSQAPIMVVKAFIK
ncbi:class I mannose-6-phosphate isomerase [Belliella sp. DSM 111904]|uniref:Class I mannose-6-phosphate isomerase n=1 Tax=Belliella filtrata TaxID=2923435 RepID=A0ABS9UY37_9BACT|nr:class I mannose-6-phosphate isomerase [Belliella filtrata]MCH7409086.1 class I mannose-6-phosphate isomerase [Belliella filtrata]